MDIIEAQNSFKDLVTKISSNDLPDFFRWIQTTYLTSECLGEKPAIAYTTLNQIANDIKLLVPKTGVLSSETISYPSDGENSDCNVSTTVSVDAFLYDDTDIDELVDDGHLHTHYCLDCSSDNTKQLTFISHSASKQKISYIFTGFLKTFDFKNKTVLDVGSRFGPVLYGAYLYTSADKIIGIEINSELCVIQNKIIDKYKMNDRIEIRCGDIKQFGSIVNCSDLIILNNVFEFFNEPDKRVECWHFLYDNIKSGTVLVTVPSIEDTFESLPETKIDLSNWVSRQHIRDPLLAMSVQDLEELSEICVYKVN